MTLVDGHNLDFFWRYYVNEIAGSTLIAAYSLLSFIPHPRRLVLPFMKEQGRHYKDITIKLCDSNDIGYGLFKPLNKTQGG